MTRALRRGSPRGACTRPGSPCSACAVLRELAIPLGIAFLTTIAGGGGGQPPVTRVVVYGLIGAVVAVASASWAG